MALFLFSSLQVHAAEVEPLKGTAIINVDKLNVRSGPSRDYEKLGTLSKEVEVEVKGIVEPDWYVIDFEGKDGYISSEYVVFTPEEEIEGGFELVAKKYIVMALVVMILIISGITVYTFVRLQKEQTQEEEEEEIPVTDHDDTNMHLGEITYDTYRIDIDPKYFEQTTMIPQPESIWEEMDPDKKDILFQKEIAKESHIDEAASSETDIKNLDSKLEQASAQIAALQKEVEQLKKNQTGPII